MPKTKLDKFSKREDPPIDWLWAAVLERKMVKRVDLKTMAKTVGVSYPYMRRLIVQSPWDWPTDVRKAVCGELGIHLDFTPETIKTCEEAR